jgi:hypothetical protein
MTNLLFFKEVLEMVQGNATLVVDLGNSSTKGKVLFGKDSQTGKFRERKFDIPNIFAPIDEGYVVSSDYDDATSTILHVDTELNGSIIKGDFCNGELQQKEKPLCTIKPSASEKKYNLDSTVLSYRLAFLFACKAIMNMQRISDFSQLDITWTVVTLLPPGDLDEGKDAIIALIEKIDRLQAVFPEVDIPIKITKTVVLPEGFCAYAGVVYDIGHVYRPDYKFLIEETVLVIDIGAGTSDILLIKDNKLVQNSKYTITQGGNNVYQTVRRGLRMKGLSIDDASIKTGLITGKIKDGAKEVSIVDNVNNAKAEVAQKIVSEIQDFFDVTDISPRSISYVLICGGGSMQDSDIPEIAPLSQKVIENFKKLSPNSELVEIPTHLVVKELEDGDTTKVEEQISPRELNLLGASILAELV